MALRGSCVGLLVLTTAVAFGQSAALSAPPGEPQGLESRVEAALRRAGARRGQIEGFLAGQAGERALAARFLVAWMPTVDLVTLDEAELAENLDLAFRARAETAYGRDVPWGIFLHYVLPHRVTQERFEAHRRRFFDALAPLVGNRTSMVDAALGVNRWCAHRVKFVQTEFRDQSPGATERHGRGRCEELMIYCIAAMRAAGIPARPCSAPWWVVTDNNHAWVEVWVDGEWHYLGACEGTPALGRTWFRGPAQRAGHVVSRRYGEIDAAPTGDIVMSRSRGVASIDSTAVYARTHEIVVELCDEGGAPVPNARCAVYAWNYGALRALFALRSDAEGRVPLRLGLGEYFVSAGNETLRAGQIVRSAADAASSLRLVLRPDGAVPEAFWLRYPTPVEAQRAFAETGEREAQRAAQWQPELGARPEPDLWRSGADPRLDVRLARDETAHLRESLQALLQSARGNWREFATAILQTPTSELPLLLSLAEGLTPLDRYEITAATLRDHLRGCLGVPEQLAQREHVLALRANREHIGAWRGALQDRHAALRGSTPGEIARALAERILPALAEDEASALGPPQGPREVALSGRATAIERAVYGTCVLRALGVAARFDTLSGAVFWHDGATWHRLAGTGQQVAAGVAERGVLRVRRTRAGEPVLDTEHLGISRWEDGLFLPLRLPAPERESGALRYLLPSGRYLVTSGVRNANGDAHVETRDVAIGPTAPVELRFSLDLPADAGIFRFPIARKVEELGALRLGADGPALAELCADRAVLLLLGRDAHEPSTRAWMAIREAWPRYAALGAALHVVHESPGRSAAPGAPAHRRWVAPGLFPDLGIELDAEGSRLPSVLLLQRGGQVLLWTEGYDPGLPELLRAASRQVQAGVD